ncbi:Nitrite reductase (NAD(P)H) small subunit [Pseudoalteromonas carrageenovora]|uniref:Nitrite reductase (NADH) small subunit n=1 Tax=Pseudoalteromonas carrageenovora IAM 12662 TaxID=1314868 RepID=A0A2K4X9Z5_PSEVC|nr:MULTISPECIES: nitrite reductase small subunit NirD [Pseudoalteromonas]KTF10542.1 nitrite reductase small subunit [Pseudoalteromonas sp. H103]MBE0381387.1 nitrite reductase (NADH) small subunit [Pseudoalteromonas carrageenovora IAM 12662]MDO6636530.1 nitrite reductase small subunit NirD [Pseudoalteromonas carrageenovora]MDO6647104.1 nitrite reductase small subunit NirD [Pseudoalteromonas carrageenovora]QBJ72031.1 Nitrite reductase (NAD(P)H) small subunit [Pseudoalteromonas carrageenovora]
MSWHNIGTIDDLVANSGVCALVNNQQVAIFYVPQNKEGVFAISNYDPIGKANVLSRGIIGSIEGKLVVASPLYKQHFCLATGECLEAEAIHLPVFDAKIEDGNVLISAEPKVIKAVA